MAIYNPLEYILHSDGSNGSAVSPESREDIERLKGRVRSGDRVGVNADTEGAIRRANVSLGG